MEIVASMRLGFKAANVFLVLVCAYFLLYTFTVYLVVDSLYVTDGAIAWRTSPAGSLFPVPRRSGMLQALSQVSELDKVIYFGLIENKLLILIDLVLVALLATSVAYTMKQTGPRPT